MVYVVNVSNNNGRKSLYDAHLLIVVFNEWLEGSNAAAAITLGMSLLMAVRHKHVSWCAHSPAANQTATFT